MDGKSLCGTFARTGGAGVHLLAAISHTTGDDRTEGIALAQRQHTTREHATYLVERGGHYGFTVKENQHRLCAT